MSKLGKWNLLFPTHSRESCCWLSPWAWLFSWPAWRYLADFRIPRFRTCFLNSSQ